MPLLFYYLIILFLLSRNRHFSCINIFYCIVKWQSGIASNTLMIPCCGYVAEIMNFGVYPKNCLSTLPKSIGSTLKQSDVIIAGKSRRLHHGE